MAKLGLGTVQIGIPYGNKNNNPLMSEVDAHSLLFVAANSGITFFDTAAAYGESENRIGSSDLLEKFSELEVVTKISSPPKELWSNPKNLLAWMTQELQKSLSKLRMKQAGLVLFHESSLEFIQNKSVLTSAEELLNSGLVKNLGHSVYTPEQAMAAIETGVCSALQVPVNLIDRRFIEPTFLKQVKSKNIRLIGRSIFLQGILNDQAALPQVKKSDQLKTLKSLLQDAFAPHALEEAALNFIHSKLDSIFDIILLGAQNSNELKNSLTLFEKCKNTSIQVDHAKLKKALEFSEKHELYDPSTWNR